MQVYKKANLKPFHTFSIDVTCEWLVIVESIKELALVYQNVEWQFLPKLLLGKGSNVLFTEHYEGLVVVNRITGIEVLNTESDWLLHINGGEDWPSLVKWALDNEYHGLENLALIPGCVGSAPIQNIGAYGVEFKDICNYVEVLDLDTFEISRLKTSACNFAYRDSIFKKELYGKVVITAVGLKLLKQWCPIVHYGCLKMIPKQDLTPMRVYEEVCKSRRSKLPDPNQIGNAGSFFKNPVICVSHYEKLKACFPDIVVYPFGHQKVKVAAGWLIEQCELKGTKIGGAMVHEDQALILINIQNAAPLDVIRLAKKICVKVYEKYQISLEHEVRVMNSHREIYLEEL